MARKTIKQKLTELEKKFPKRTAYGFLHRTKAELSKTYSTIFVYALIYDDERGHSVFVWEPHRRGHDWNAKEWDRWLTSKGLDILAHDVMEAINTKRGSSWEMQRIIGYHGSNIKETFKKAGEGKDALYKRQNKSKHKGRNKANA
jgi:hypothetical protein